MVLRVCFGEQPLNHIEATTSLQMCERYFTLSRYLLHILTIAMENKKLPRITILGKRIILSLLAFVLIWPLTVGVYTLVYKGYTLIDRTTFPSVDAKLKEMLDKTPPDAPEPAPPASSHVFATLMPSLRNSSSLSAILRGALFEI